MGRLSYWRRILSAYLGPGSSNLSFWHERPEAHPRARFDRLGPYYMTFADKASYAGPFDRDGVPQLDYRGRIGVQHNPIAIAQYGLAHYNRLAEGEKASRAPFLRQADWLVERLEPNAQGLRVWMHRFDWEYRELLRAPWYSALAQGQGVSLLVRAHAETGQARYLEAAISAFEALLTPIGSGGVQHVDETGDVWLEEYLVAPPPTHILNGFLWALWGVLDYRLLTGRDEAAKLFDACVRTLERNLGRYDTGYWSLYELSDTWLKMMASPFYHSLHIVQLDVTHRMTGRAQFRERGETWRRYQQSAPNRIRSLTHKCAFKVLYY